MPTDQRRENSQLQDIQGEEGGRELIWYTCQEIQGAVDHHGTEVKRWDQGEQGHQENFRNPLREAKHQRDLLKDYFNHVGALAGQEDRV